MDIKQLRYFVEVARRRSFTAAAAALYVTQPRCRDRLPTLKTNLEKFCLIDRLAALR